MNRQLLVRLEAEQDVREAQDLYDGQLTGLGDEFLSAVAQCIRKLSERLNCMPFIIVMSAESERLAFLITSFTV